MLYSMLRYVLMIYGVLSSSIAIAGVALIAKHYFFPKPSRTRSILKLIDLGLDGSGLRSEPDPWLLRKHGDD